MERGARIGQVRARNVPAPHLLQRHDATGVERFAGAWSDHRTRHHSHLEYQLTLSVKGSGRFTYLGGEARIPEGCFALFHPCEAHAIGNAERGAAWHLRSLHIPPRWFEEDGSAPLLQPAPLLADPELLGAFDAVWQAFDTSRPAIAQSLHRLAKLLRGRPGVEPTRHARSELTRRCLSELASILDRPMSMRELARLVEANPAKIRRAVTTATGLPPLTWHLQRRIQEAKHRLARGDGIAATALATGFADQAHFTRHFTRHVGVSPSRYAAGVRGCGLVA